MSQVAALSLVDHEPADHDPQISTTADGRDPSDKLVRDHMLLVHTIAMRMKVSLGRALSTDDLVGYGSHGLVEAARRFDSSRGVRFTTFAYYRIRGAIIDGVRRAGWYSRAQVGHYRDQLDAEASAPDQDDRSRNDLSESSATSRPTADRGAHSLSVTITSADVDYASVEGEAARLHPADDQDPHQVLEKKELMSRIRGLLHTLPANERRLIELHYFSDLTLKDAGAEMGLSKSWACRMHDRVMRKLRDALATEYAA